MFYCNNRHHCGLARFFLKLYRQNFCLTLKIPNCFSWYSKSKHLANATFGSMFLIISYYCNSCNKLSHRSVTCNKHLFLFIYFSGIGVRTQGLCAELHPQSFLILTQHLTKLLICPGWAWTVILQSQPSRTQWDYRHAPRYWGNKHLFFIRLCRLMVGCLM